MNRTARYMLMARERDKRDNEHNKTDITRYEYGDHNYDMNFEVDSRFRDRRGREHYDNGRFAPMRSEYSPEYRRDYDRQRDNGRYREQRGGPRSNYPMYNDDDEDDDRMEMIGFGNREDMRSQLPERIYGGSDEMEHRTSPRIAGGAMGAEMIMTPEIAKEWVKGMHNEDGTMGEHWNMEQIKKLMTQRGIDYNHAEVYAIMNALYSDYCKVLKKYGVNSPEMYLDLAMAWLNDKDAKPGKAINYYEYIVK